MTSLISTLEETATTELLNSLQFIYSKIARNLLVPLAFFPAVMVVEHSLKVVTPKLQKCFVGINTFPTHNEREFSSVLKKKMQ